MNQQMRMEHSALQIAGIVFEKIGYSFDKGQFLYDTLEGVFKCLHFYRNNTKSKIIPAEIMKTIHAFFSTFMVCHGTQALLTICESIQKDILFMLLNSEAAAIKHV